MYNYRQCINFQKWGRRLCLKHTLLRNIDTVSEIKKVRRGGLKIAEKRSKVRFVTVVSLLKVEKIQDRGVRAREGESRGNL